MVWRKGQACSLKISVMAGACNLGDLEHIEQHSLAQGLALTHYDTITHLGISEAWWKKCQWKPLSRVFATPWTIAVHGILQARMLEWAAFRFSRGSSQPRDQTQVSHTAGGVFTSWATEKSKNTGVGSLSLLQWSSWSGSQSRVSCIAGGFLTNVAIRETWWQVHKHNVTSFKTYILW